MQNEEEGKRLARYFKNVEDLAFVDIERGEKHRIARFRRRKENFVRQ